MSQFSLRTADNRTAYEPGETITVVADWQCDDEIERLELRVGWMTAGKGTVDDSVEKTIILEHPRRFETREVTVELPSAPYSFSGKLISLLWSLTLDAGKLGSEQMPFIIAPGAKEIELHRPEQPV